MFKNSTLMLKANLVGQVCGILVMLLVPNFLSKEDYSKIVYIGFLTSFGAIYDFGLGAVYSRTAPTLIKRRLVYLQTIESTLMKSMIVLGLVFSLAISSVYYVKYENIIECLVLFFYVPLTLWISFFFARHVVHGNFKEFSEKSYFQSLMKLLQIPVVASYSFGGWIWFSLVSNVIFATKIFDRKLIDRQFSTSFLRRYIKEGVAMSTKTLVWLQMLSLPRTYAVVNFPDSEIASYGLVNSIFQIIFSISLALFIPITRQTYIEFSYSKKNGFLYARRMLLITTPVFFVSAVLLMLLIPSVIKFTYIGYDVQAGVIWGYFATIAMFPFFFMMGNILAAKKIDNLMTLILSVWYVVGWGVAMLTGCPEFSLPLIILGSSTTMAISVNKIKKG